jgi:hypothetical protein
LPTGDIAKIVTVTASGEATAGITVITEAIAEKETAPKETVAKFGEIYVFSPEFNEDRVLEFANGRRA